MQNFAEVDEAKMDEILYNHIEIKATNAIDLLTSHDLSKIPKVVPKSKPPEPSNPYTSIPPAPLKNPVKPIKPNKSSKPKKSHPKHSAPPAPVSLSSKPPNPVPADPALPIKATTCSTHLSPSQVGAPNQRTCKR